MISDKRGTGQVDKKAQLQRGKLKGHIAVRFLKAGKKEKLTFGPSSRPLAPSNCEPGLLIALTGTPKTNLYICHINSVQRYV